MKKFASFLLGASWAIAAPIPAALAQPQVLNAQDADIRAFIADVARQTGRTFVIDPRVKGTVSVYSDGPLTDEQLFEVFLSTLRANGLTATPSSGGSYIIAPDDGASQIAGGGGGLNAALATEVFRFGNVDAGSVAETLRPFVGKQGQVIANRRSNTVVVADYPANLRRIRDLVARLDQDSSTVETVSLRNSSARELADVVTKVMGAAGDQDGGQYFSIIPVQGSNSLILRGNAASVARVAAMVRDLDQRAQSNADVKVISLQHADAEKLLPVLQQMVGQPVSAPGADGAPAAAVLSAGNGPKIARYPGANALIISADAETQRRISEVIRQIDIRREQVLVEAIVVEVSNNAAKELGVQFILSGQEGGNTPLFATNFSDRAPNLLAITGAVVGDNSLGNDDASSEVLAGLRDLAVQSLIAYTGGIAGFAGNINDDALFGFIVNAVKRDTGSNLLSTPSVMTLDNEEASILVGQDVPISTGRVLGDNNTNPFQTVERREIGVKLGVRPQINAGGGITLYLTQEVSSVAPELSNGVGDLVFNKREIKTTVLADDGEIVVLGGLLDQNESIVADRLPILGDIPILGRLFGNDRRTKDKTNLMVFLRPRIVRNVEDARQISAERYNTVRAAQYNATRGENSSLEETVRDYLRATIPVERPASPPVAAAEAPAQDASADAPAAASSSPQPSPAPSAARPDGAGALLDVPAGLFAPIALPAQPDPVPSDDEWRLPPALQAREDALIEAAFHLAEEAEDSQEPAAFVPPRLQKMGAHWRGWAARDLPARPLLPAKRPLASLSISGVTSPRFSAHASPQSWRHVAAPLGPEL